MVSVASGTGPGAVDSTSFRLCELFTSVSDFSYSSTHSYALISSFGEYHDKKAQHERWVEWERGWAQGDATGRQLYSGRYTRVFFQLQILATLEPSRCAFIT